MLKLYPDQVPGRLVRALADLSVLAWTAAWILVGITVHRTVLGLQAIAEGVAGTGRTFDSWVAAFRNSAKLPVPGFNEYVRSLTGSLQEATGDQLLQRGAEAHDAIERLALVLALAVSIPPIVMVGSRFVVWRCRDARERGATLAFIASVQDQGRRDEAMALLAFRAVATLPFARLMKATPDPVGDLVAGRYEALAAEMVKAAGLRPWRLDRRLRA